MLDGTLEANEAIIEGAGYGSIIAGKIAKNLPIIFFTEKHGPAMRSMTAEIVNMGVIHVDE